MPDDIDYADIDREIQQDYDYLDSTSQVSRPTGGSGNLISYAMDRLQRDYNWKPYQAAAIVGNLMYESAGGNTTARGDGGAAFGLAQWTADRRKGLVEYANSQGRFVDDVDTQLDYIHHELGGSHSRALDALHRAKNVDEATVAFSDTFEKPGVPNMSSRLKWARLAEAVAYGKPQQGAARVSGVDADGYTDELPSGYTASSKPYGTAGQVHTDADGYTDELPAGYSVFEKPFTGVSWQDRLAVSGGAGELLPEPEEFTWSGEPQTPEQQARMKQIVFGPAEQQLQSVVDPETWSLERAYKQAMFRPTGQQPQPVVDPRTGQLVPWSPEAAYRQESYRRGPIEGLGGVDIGLVMPGTPEYENLPEEAKWITAASHKPPTPVERTKKHFRIKPWQPKAEEVTLAQLGLGGLAAEVPEVVVDAKTREFRKTPLGYIPSAAVSGFLGVAKGAAGLEHMFIGTGLGKIFADNANEWTQLIQPDERSIVFDLVNAGASMATFFIPGIGIVRGLGYLEKISKVAALALGCTFNTVFESGTEAGNTYWDVLDKLGAENMTPRQFTSANHQAMWAATMTFIANLPLLGLTNRLAYFSEWGKALKRFFFGGVLEGAQEAGQGIISTIASGNKLDWSDILYEGALAFPLGGGGAVVSGKLLRTESDKKTDFEKWLLKMGDRANEFRDWLNSRPVSKNPAILNEEQIRQVLTSGQERATALGARPGPTPVELARDVEPMTGTERWEGRLEAKPEERPWYPRTDSSNNVIEYSKHTNAVEAAKAIRGVGVSQARVVKNSETGKWFVETRLSEKWLKENQPAVVEPTVDWGQVPSPTGEVGAVGPEFGRPGETVAPPGAPFYGSVDEAQYNELLRRQAEFGWVPYTRPVKGYQGEPGMPVVYKSRSGAIGTATIVRNRDGLETRVLKGPRGWQVLVKRGPAGGAIDVSGRSRPQPETLKPGETAVSTEGLKPSMKEAPSKPLGVVRGKFSVNSSQVIDVLVASYRGNPNLVAVKELVQNSFDSVKEYQRLYGYPDGTGLIEVSSDWDSGLIQVEDNGMGMTLETVQEGLFTLGGTDKGTLPEPHRSGGLGFAKLAFMFLSKEFHLDTVRDGERLIVRTTGHDIRMDNYVIERYAADPSEHGTTVRVIMPKERVNKRTGEIESIYFPTDFGDTDFLTHPLYGPVTVIYNNLYRSTRRVLPLGDAYKRSDIPFVTTVQTDWADIDLYLGSYRYNKDYSARHYILSSGLFQFTTNSLKDVQDKKILYDIILDIKPKVPAKDIDYPFDNEREGFRHRISPDIKALGEYISRLVASDEAKSLSETFADSHVLPRVKGLGPIKVPERALKKVSVQTGQTPVAEGLSKPSTPITISGGVVTDASGNVIHNTNEKAVTLTIDTEATPLADYQYTLQSGYDEPIYHNNTNLQVLNSEPIRRLMVGVASVFADVRDAVATTILFRYVNDVKNAYVGISIDENYFGLYTNTPFKAFTINPFGRYGIQTNPVGYAQRMLGTMIHELAHAEASGHGSSHNAAMQTITIYLAEHGLYKQFKSRLTNIIKRDFDSLKEMCREFESSSTRNIKDSFTGSDERKVEPSRDVGVPEGRTRDTGRSVQGREGRLGAEDLRATSEVGGEGQEHQGIQGTGRFVGEAALQAIREGRVSEQDVINRSNFEQLTQGEQYAQGQTEEGLYPGVAAGQPTERSAEAQRQEQEAQAPQATPTSHYAAGAVGWLRSDLPEDAAGRRLLGGLKSAGGKGFSELWPKWFANIDYSPEFGKNPEFRAASAFAKALGVDYVLPVQYSAAAGFIMTNPADGKVYLCLDEDTRGNSPTNIVLHELFHKAVAQQDRVALQLLSYVNFNSIGFRTFKEGFIENWTKVCDEPIPSDWDIAEELVGNFVGGVETIGQWGKEGVLRRSFEQLPKVLGLVSDWKFGLAKQAKAGGWSGVFASLQEVPRPGDIDALGFYSRLAMLLEAKMSKVKAESWTIDQAVVEIKALQKSGLVKVEEVEDSGVLDVLEDLKNEHDTPEGLKERGGKKYRISKSELLEMAKGKYAVEEIVYVGPDYKIHKAREDYLRVLDSVTDRLNAATEEFPGYTTAMLETMSPQEIADAYTNMAGVELELVSDQGRTYARVKPGQAVVDISGRVNRPIREAEYFASILSEAMYLKVSPGATLSPQPETIRGESQYSTMQRLRGPHTDYRDLRYAVPRIEPVYNAPHSLGKNVFAHVFGSARDVKLPNGEVLHNVWVVEQAQSDAHQRAHAWEDKKKTRRIGYRDQLIPLPKGYKLVKIPRSSSYSGYTYFVVAEDVVIPNKDAWFDIYNYAESSDVIGFDYNPNSAIGRAYTKLGIEVPLYSNIPSELPYKSTWHNFLMKRQLRRAVERGYNGIAVVSGEFIQDINSLAQVVDEIFIVKHLNKTYTMRGFREGQEVTAGVPELRNMTRELLVDYIGEDKVRIAEEQFGIDWSEKVAELAEARKALAQQLKLIKRKINSLESAEEAVYKTLRSFTMDAFIREQPEFYELLNILDRSKPRIYYNPVLPSLVVYGDFYSNIERTEVVPKDSIPARAVDLVEKLQRWTDDRPTPSADAFAESNNKLTKIRGELSKFHNEAKELRNKIRRMSKQPIISNSRHNKVLELQAIHKKLNSDLEQARKAREAYDIELKKLEYDYPNLSAKTSRLITSQPEWSGIYSIFERNHVLDVLDTSIVLFDDYDPYYINMMPVSDKTEFFRLREIIKKNLAADFRPLYELADKFDRTDAAFNETSNKIQEMEGVVNNIKRQIEAAKKGAAYLAGENLIVTKAWPTTFYDKLYPSALLKATKQYGGKIVEAEVLDAEVEKPEHKIVHLLEFTPAIRKGIGLGVPKYSMKEAPSKPVGKPASTIGASWRPAILTPEEAARVGQAPVSEGLAGVGGPSQTPRVRQTVAEVQEEQRARSIAQDYEPGSVRDVANKFLDEWTRVTPHSDFKGLLGEFLYKLQRSVHEMDKRVKGIKKIVKGVDRRSAISVYVATGGDAGVMAEWGAKSKSKELREWCRLAQELTPEEIQIARDTRAYFDEMLQQGREAGLLDTAVPAYLTQVWRRVRTLSGVIKGFINEVNHGVFNTNFRYAKKRFYANVFEAMEAGKTPVSMDVCFLLTTYNNAFSLALESRKLIKALPKKTALDGLPLAITAGNVIESPKQVEETRAFEDVPDDYDMTGRPKPNKFYIEPRAVSLENYANYVPIEHPSFRGYKWVRNDSDGVPIIMHGDIYVHKSIARHMRNLVKQSAVRKSSIGRAALSASSQIKSLITLIPYFHKVAVGTHAIGHRINPFNPPEIDMGNPKLARLVRHSMMLFDPEHNGYFIEGLGSYGLIDKMYWIGPKIRENTDYLFRNYIPRLKAATGLAILERNLKRFAGRYTEDEIYELSAKQANEAYGELNYRWIGRNRTFQDILRLALFAPDFLESRAKFFTSGVVGIAGTRVKPSRLFKKDARLRDAIEPGSGIEQLEALVVLGIVIQLVCCVVNYVFGDHDDKDPLHKKLGLNKPFNLILGKRGNQHVVSVRSVLGDAIHLVTNPLNFAYWRLNPVFVRPSIYFSGRDEYGRRVTRLQAVRDTLISWTPIPLQGLLGKREHKLWQALLATFGVVAHKHVTPADEVMYEYFANNRIDRPGDSVLVDMGKYHKKYLEYVRDGKQEEAAAVIADAAKDLALTTKTVRNWIEESIWPANVAGFRQLSLEYKYKALLEAEPWEEKLFLPHLGQHLGRLSMAETAEKQEAAEKQLNAAKRYIDKYMTRKNQQAQAAAGGGR